MTGPIQHLMTMQRPRILVKTAKLALRDYQREPTLRRLLKCSQLPSEPQLLLDLLAIEAELDDQRRAADAAYSVKRHILVLTALIAEAARCQVGVELAAAV